MIRCVVELKMRYEWMGGVVGGDNDAEAEIRNPNTVCETNPPVAPLFLQTV